ncbi:MAG: single-stranded DNA-binding protein [bacterium]|nr:single-stranded DNA-binding protein [bacterium]
MDLNRATILGRLTRDPEVKTTPNGRTVAKVGIATNRTWTDQSGAKQEKVEYHNCVFWGKIAEIAGQYLSKGKRVYVEGRLQTSDWTDTAGVKKYRTEIIVDNMIMLDGGRPAGTPVSENPTSSNDSTVNYQNDEPVEEVRVEDIPF